MNNEKVIVLSARQFNFAHDVTGQVFKGTKIEFVRPGNPIDEKGSLPVSTATLPYDDYDKIQSLPAYVDLEYQILNKQGKLELKPKQIVKYHQKLTI